MDIVLDLAGGGVCGYAHLGVIHELLHSISLCL
jgi:predicted acylesterase/phospholipase RssA